MIIEYSQLIKVLEWGLSQLFKAQYNQRLRSLQLILNSIEMKMDQQRFQTQKSMKNVAPGHNQSFQNNRPTQLKFFDLFRFATRADWVLMIIGSFCAFVMGTAVPFLSVVWGTTTGSYVDRDRMLEETKGAMFKTFGIAGGTLIAGWGMFACWKIAAERQGVACRKQYLRSLLRQEMGWFDTINSLQLASQFVNDTSQFQGAIGEKLASIIMTISTLIASLVIAFVKGWLLSLVTIVSIPVVIIGANIYSYAIGKKNFEVENEYSQARGLSEQAISAVKTVKQLNGEQFEADRYAATLKRVTEIAIKYGPFIGLGYGLIYCTNFLSYGLSFWFGSNCVQDNSICPSSLNNGQPYAAGDVLVVIFSLQEVGFIFLQFIPAIKKISEGRAAAANIFKIIDRKPLVASPPNGIKPQQFRGVFCFEKVTFAYPKDPSHPIISNLSFKINSKSAAFVGQSGCGKSTLFQLMMRFYDPDQGRITLDGYDLRDLDLEWLRRQIGYVGQGSFLFTGTIRENLLLGKEDATMHEINNALRKAEAYDFVYSLKDKLETHTGTGGSQISGGQMQRLAIARTLLKNPKILLLDEATSALDRQNEKKIQKTLQRISAEKWTITIAHNLRTIMHCKEIFVMNRGSIQQVGAFWELKRFKDFHKKMMQMEQPSEQQVRAYIIELTKRNSLKASNNLMACSNVTAEAALDESTIRVKQEQDVKQSDEPSVFLRLLPYVKPRQGLFAVGILTCILNGTIFPAIGIVLSKMLFTLIFYPLDPVQGRKDANLYSLLFAIFGIIFLILCVIQQSVFSIIGQEITENVRGQIYHKILKMPMSWFQNKKNHWSSLSSRLASESMAINKITTFYITLIFQSISNLLAGAIIALVYQFNTALVAVGLVHLIIVFGILYTAVAGRYNAQTEKQYEDSSSLITESMLSIRTIHSLAHGQTILQKYSKKLKVPLQKSTWRGNISGILFGFSQCIMYISFAIILYKGSVFIRYYDVAVSDVFSATYPILFVGLNLINSAHFMPDINAAKLAAANLFSILDAEDEDQLQIKAQSKLLKTPIDGNIVFRNVCFKYDSRDDQVFLDLNFEIKEGTKVGFVGASGCGKSTIHQLLQRFCDPCVGQILIDGVNIADYDIHHLRASLGIVNQDPTLFNDTIANNIKYNCEGITQEQIMQAANDACFNPDQVSSPLEQYEEETEAKSGFDKNVGVKGSNVSGGQKQRLAIARMLIRRPNVLLFDEATSALDSATEKRVQTSLDNIMQGKTSIVIAHRIDTVKNSDAIFLFDQGDVVEVGTYDQLMWMKGMFYALQKEREGVQQQK